MVYKVCPVKVFFFTNFFEEESYTIIQKVSNRQISDKVTDTKKISEKHDWNNQMESENHFHINLTAFLVEVMCMWIPQG